MRRGGWHGEPPGVRARSLCLGPCFASLCSRYLGPLLVVGVLLQFSPFLGPASANQAQLLSPQIFSLKGTLTPGSTTAVDSDTNDPGAVVISNNSPETAQPLMSPVSLGGYLTASATGVSGDRFEKRADDEDWYRLNLVAGQIISLLIAEHDGSQTNPANPDFDLYLVDSETQKDVQAAEEEGPQELIKVLVSGDYQLLVKAQRGASNYHLQIMPIPAPLEDAASVQVSPHPYMQARFASPQGPALNPLSPGASIPDDEHFSRQWNATMLELPAAWHTTTGSSDVVIALLDSGILPDHPDLIGRICTQTEGCAGYDFVSQPDSAADGDGIDPNPEDPGVIGPANGIPFHGTRIAGVLGALGNNGIGIAGIDWSARIMPLRVFGQGERSSHDIIQGLRYAAGLSNDSGRVPAQPAKIINLSLGGGGYTPAEQDLFSQLYEAGIFVFAAAGNDASSLPFYPGAYAGVMAVSAVDIQKKLAFYSNSGVSIDLAAPGGNLNTDQNADAVPDGIITTSAVPSSQPRHYSYVPSMGTSMAVPQVAAVVALMLAVDPALTPAEFEALLAAGALTEDLGTDGAAVRNDQFGFGLINAKQAVRAAQLLAEGGSLPAALVMQPQQLIFGAGESDLPLQLSQTGEGPLKLTGIKTSVPWVRAIPVLAETQTHGGFGEYRILIDRSGLVDGRYSAQLQISTDQPATRTVSLQIQVGPTQASNLGAQTLYLYDADSSKLVQSLNLIADPQTGAVGFNFTNLKPGRYRLSSSSDHDHDSLVCDPGEFCGSYSVEGKPVVIKVTDHDLSGIDFVSDFEFRASQEL